MKKIYVKRIRTGFITPGVGPSPSEKRRAKESEAVIVAGTTAIQLDAGYAFRSRAKPEWGYETSSKVGGAPFLSFINGLKHTFISFFLVLYPSIIYAAGGKPATKIYNVADTRAMEPGLSKWIADIYNSNLWLYGVLTVLVMVIMGLVLGFGADKLFSLSGIKLKKLEHHE